MPGPRSPPPSSTVSGSQAPLGHVLCAHFVLNASFAVAPWAQHGAVDAAAQVPEPSGPLFRQLQALGSELLRVEVPAAANSSVAFALGTLRKWATCTTVSGERTLPLCFVLVAFPISRPLTPMRCSSSGSQRDGRRRRLPCDRRRRTVHRRRAVRRGATRRDRHGARAGGRDGDDAAAALPWRRADVLAARRWGRDVADLRALAPIMGYE